MNRWIGPVKKSMERRGTEGSFSALAKRKGHTTHQEAELDKHKSGGVGGKARLALAFESARHHKHAS
jgi:hypothetical protein